MRSTKGAARRAVGIHEPRAGRRALSAQRTRLDVVSANIANAQTTRVQGEVGPYRRRDVVLAAESATDSFGAVLRDRLGQTVETVSTPKIVTDQAPPKLVYDPTHPDANTEGYVAYPNITSSRRWST